MSLLKSSFTIGGLTMVSRVLGFLRDVLIAAILGVGPVADAFFVAFKLPNFFRRLFAEGAFSAAFVPLVVDRLTAGGRGGARIYAQEVLAVVVVALAVFTTVFQLAMPWAMHAIAPGFSGERFDLAVVLAQITFPFLLFISLVSHLSGVLFAVGRFGAAAAMPILLNLFMIAAIIGLSPLLQTPGHALAWAVSAAGAVQLVCLVWECRRAGFVIRLPRPRLTPGVKLLLTKMLPGVIGAGVVQINLLVDVVIASLLPAGSVSYLYYADRVNQLPLGVVGVAIGTALLPLLSRQLKVGDETAASESVNRALEMVLLLTIPGAAALILISDPVIAVLFERGQFAAAETAATSAALLAYATGLPAYVLIKVLGPCFFARMDTVTPVKIGAACVLLNIVLNLILMGPLLHVGVALATSISSWINALLLAIVLSRRGQLSLDRRLRRALPRIVAATAVMLSVLWGVSLLLTGLAWPRAVDLACFLILGAISFFAVAFVTGAVSPVNLRAPFWRSSNQG